MLIDTHCHLFFDELKNNLDSVLERANNAGVNKFICVGTNIDDSKKSLSIAESNDNIFAAAGVHPHDAKDVEEGYINSLYELMEYESMIAVGEIGLDYFRNISDPKIQKNIFRQQMEVAQDLNRPVIIHNRDSDTDMIKIIKDYPDVIGVSHCFSSTIETANSFLEMGYYISFSGNITFNNSHLPEVIKQIPLNRILVETDSPFLSPEPERGKKNEPSKVRIVAQKVADIHNIDLDSLARKTSDNASELFRLP